jgi:hypothetical protein
VSDLTADLDAIDKTVADRELRETIYRLQRDLEKAKAKREELVEAVYRAATDAARAMTIDPVAPPKADRRKARDEVAICLLADWQWGKVTPEYDSDVAKRRVARYADKVVELIEIKRASRPVKEARIYLLGDLVEGEEIFPGQAHRIDSSLYSQLFHAAEALAALVRTISSAVPSVTVRGVIGNHGAMGGPIRRSYHPETNMDAVLYNIARMLVKDDRVTWPETFVAGERAWYAVDEVLGKRWFLFHGDQVKSASFGIPWYGFAKRLLGWATSVEPFDYAASGHWHNPVREQVNAITHWGAGSIESANTFAQEYLASGGQRPSQWLLFQGERGVTDEWLVQLD